MTVDSVLWRRLDGPGHDACRLVETVGSFELHGTAVFAEKGAPANLAYQVVCDRAWRTMRGRIRGWFGERSLDLRIARTEAGVWTLDGAAVPGLDHCVDLDLGFTPATNLTSLRRLALAEGRKEEVHVAWLDVSKAALDALSQLYERRTESAYWYEAPSFGYAALLEVTPVGFIRRYPGLWEAELIE